MACGHSLGAPWGTLRVLLELSAVRAPGTLALLGLEVASLEHIPIPKIDTPKGDDNLRDSPSKNKGIPEIGIVMRRCPA
eukprot:5662647-Pyramimonas_sp.AAC.1